MSTTNESVKNYKSIDNDKENNNIVLNKEERNNKNGSDIKQKVHQDQINSTIKKENTLSDCKENTCQLGIFQQVNSTDNHEEEKSNDQDTQKVGEEPLTNKAVKKKLKKQRQRLRKKAVETDQTEETKMDITEAIKADFNEHELQEEEHIKTDSPTTTSEDLNQNNIHNDIENNSNANDDSVEQIDFLNNIPAFVHATIKKDNKKLLSTKVHKKAKEDDTKVNFRQQNLPLETLNNNGNGYYDIDVENDFTLVKYKHSKHPDSLRSSEDFATLAINLILEDQILQAIQHLSTAISLDPKNICHYANRSFCFLRIGAYDLAIRDANFVIKTTSDNNILAKANYLLGEAYYGLKNYEEAEKSIEKCLNIFPRNLCYIRESLRFKISQLVNMGFCERDALLTLKNHSTVMDALEKLIAESNLPQRNNNSTNDCDTIIMSYDESEIFYSDDEDNCSNTQLLSSIIKEKFPCHRVRTNKASSTKKN